MKRVLVTGASGFIGSRVIASLAQRGFEVHAAARRPGRAGQKWRWHAADLLDDTDRLSLIQRVRPSHLLHLAWYAEHGRFWQAPENVSWVAATVKLAHDFAAAGGRRAVFAGTCAEYDWTGSGLCSERETPLRPATPYGVCKDAARRVVEQVDCDVAWGRLFFLYGPREHPDRLVAAVARLLVDGRRAPTSEGSQRRDFLHVDDVAGAFATLVQSGVTGPVNIGSGEAVPVRRIIELIADAAGRPDLLDIGALQRRSTDPDELVADIARLRDEVGWTPGTGLEEGLERTVAWWREQL